MTLNRTISLKDYIFSVIRDCQSSSTRPQNKLTFLSYHRLLAPGLQTGEVLGDGYSCMCDVQCCGNSSGAHSGRCSHQPQAQREDAAACGLRGLQQRVCRLAFGSQGKSQQPVAERTHSAALLHHQGVCGLCQAANPQRSGGKDAWVDGYISRRMRVHSKARQGKVIHVTSFRQKGIQSALQGHKNTLNIRH